MSSSIFSEGWSLQQETAKPQTLPPARVLSSSQPWRRVFDMRTNLPESQLHDHRWWHTEAGVCMSSAVIFELGSDPTLKMRFYRRLKKKPILWKQLNKWRGIQFFKKKKKIAQIECRAGALLREWWGCELVPFERLPTQPLSVGQVKWGLCSQSRSCFFCVVKCFCLVKWANKCGAGKGTEFD